MTTILDGKRGEEMTITNYNNYRTPVKYSGLIFAIILAHY